MRSREAGGWFFPAVCVVCALLSAVIAVSALGGASGYTDAVNSLVTPVQAGVSKLWNSARDAAAQDRAHTAEAQNALLRERLAELEAELARAEGLGRENAELRRMLHIRDADPELELVHATVAAREPSGFSFHYLIDRGTDDGIADGDPVITADGLAGRVVQTGRNWARIAPLSDARYNVGAYVPRTKDYGVVEGDAAGGQLGCRLSYVAGSEAVITGDIVETSGLGGVFPRGLRIGRVESPLPGDQLYTSAARIAPAVDYEGMREVYVVVGFSQ